MVTGNEATEFAARITAKADSVLNVARVARDLAGYLRALDGLDLCRQWGDSLDHTSRYTADCEDHLAALTETGALYGEKP